MYACVYVRLHDVKLQNGQKWSEQRKFLSANCDSEIHFRDMYIFRGKNPKGIVQVTFIS